MAASIFHRRLAGSPLQGGLAALCALALVWGLAACALRESVDDTEGGPGVVISVNDSTRVNLDFSDMSKIVFTDSGEFDLDEIRRKMKDKGLNPDSVKITGIVVTYDSATHSFLLDNKGVKFALKVFAREDGGTRRLVLYTPETDSDVFKVQSFDPDQALFELNKHIFGSPDGFPGFLSAIKDTTKHKEMCIAELTLKETLKKAGNLKLNMVVTVAGK